MTIVTKILRVNIGFMLCSLCAFLIVPSVQPLAAEATSALGELQNLSNQIGAMSVVVDNNRESWDAAKPYVSDPSGDNGGLGQIDWSAITVAHDCDDLYFRYEVADGPLFTPDGFRYNLFVDVDKNPLTGYRGVNGQLSVGADVLIQGGQNKVTLFKFIGADQQTWNWQEKIYYPINDKARLNGGRDIEYRISISDLAVFGTAISGFNWVAWADQASSITDYYPDNGNLGDTGLYNSYTLYYQPRPDGFANPERGFYEATRTQSSTYKPLDLATLQCYRINEGVSLIHRFFFLENFVNSAISQEYLDLMQADFDKIRQAGLKVIPRFAYSETSGPNLTPPYGDASKDQILSHLAQLSVPLKKNSDVLATMQAGFIGLWGEWWFSDHFQPDADWGNRAAVVSEFLSILPTTRSVQLRTSRYKQNIFNDNTPVDQTTAHNGSDRSRAGHHNDCFLSSLSDGGTYTDTFTEYPYLEADSKWVPMGGETCDFNFLSDPEPNRLLCPTALEELARMHWSFLNIDWYQPTLRNWLDDGCYTEIGKKLGYRLKFVQGTYTDQVKPGGSFKFSLQISNEGYAAPFNPRSVELILRHSNGRVFAFKLPDDPRFWLPGNVHTISNDIKLPNDFPIGNYEVLLNLPDPEPTLYNRPEYAIRLANDNSWEADTGYNQLKHSISVVPLVFFPKAIAINTGKYNWGTLTSFEATDDDTYDINSSSTNNGKIVDWLATTTITTWPFNLSALSVNYTGQYSIKNVLQTVYLYNYKTMAWELLDKRTVGNQNDVSVTRDIISNPVNYVSSKGEMKLRIRAIHSNRQFVSWSNVVIWTVH